MLESILHILPHPLKSIIISLPSSILSQMEELRIREERPLELGYGGRFGFVTSQGELTSKPSEAIRPSHDDCMKLLDLLTNHSVYTYEEELKRGYITIAGGHRVGLAGRTVLEHGQVKLIRDITSFNIRVAREKKDCGLPVLPLLLDREHRKVHSALIISPPQHGKTTIIRDLARLISAGGCPPLMRMDALKVGVVDERSEIAACFKGVPRFDVGPRTDVLDGCPKAEGMMMMIRSLSPDVIIVDEIGRPEDALAVHEAIHAGISVIATAHGSGLEDARRRPILRELLEARAFDRIIQLRKTGGTVKVEAAYDSLGGRQDISVQIGGRRREADA
ncbi:stage III sporulation protein AA [Paenibacillus sp. J2TS4]|uniref:stage III sporulation protein AA n=1 Tax=Paenibacillus sp. J2TS4 TaxID=2807194 RepID=UPI001B16BA1D|nr:stage III sporulation protein AA [Paenibacillus sp. J2TS4]GIP32261.1 stage III sporulation protein AA [Paenibacillus sp. J2TS4]